jgi:hypothetical protein
MSAMATEYRSLLMRANRLMGANLVDANLVKIDDLEKANERLLELVASGQPRQNTVLGILCYEMKVVREEDVLQHVVDNEGVGLVDLRDYDVPEDIRRQTDVSSCWATWSVPFDREEDFHFIATAYYLSPAVRAHWEKLLGGSVLWFGVTLDAIADYLEKLELERAVPTPGTRSPFGRITPPGGTTAPFAKPGSNAPFPKPAGSVTAAPFPTAAPAPAATGGSTPPTAVPPPART